MKTSKTGRMLGPQSDRYEVVHDGESGPMITTPGGRLLRLQQFNGCAWVAPSMDPADTRFFADAANLLREKNLADARARAGDDEDA